MEKRIKVEDLLKPEVFKKHEKELFGFFEKGGTWKMLLGIDDVVIEEQYAVACQFFSEKKYKDASDLYTYLSILDPYNYDICMGLAGSKQALKKFEEALIHYTTAGAIKPEMPQPHLYLSNCFFAIREEDQAREELRKTIEIAGNQNEFAEVRREAETILQNFPKMR